MEGPSQESSKKKKKGLGFPGAGLDGKDLDGAG